MTSNREEAIVEYHAEASKLLIAGHAAWQSALRLGARARIAAAAILLGIAGMSVAPHADAALRGVTSISASEFHTCAVARGAAFCWGDNSWGELGDGTVTSSTRPVRVRGLSSGVTAISASATADNFGGAHTCAVVRAAAKCWGYAGLPRWFSQLGDGRIRDSAVPVQARGLRSGVTAISTGSTHTCAIVRGAAKCWGDNDYGEVGGKSEDDSRVPVQVRGLTSGVTSISAGNYYTCAVVKHRVKCWGGNDFDFGQFDPLFPGMRATAVSADTHITCAVANQAAKCWGGVRPGDTGVDAGTPGSSPGQVVGMASGVSIISAGYDHACAVQFARIFCWGENGGGELGDGTRAASPVPIRPAGTSSQPVSAISGGIGYTCAVIDFDRRAECWGSNGNGELGDGTRVIKLTPVAVASPIKPIHRSKPARVSVRLFAAMDGNKGRIIAQPTARFRPPTHATVRAACAGTLIFSIKSRGHASLSKSRRMRFSSGYCVARRAFRFAQRMKGQTAIVRVHFTGNRAVRAFRRSTRRLLTTDPY